MFIQAKMSNKSCEQYWPAFIQRLHKLKEDSYMQLYRVLNITRTKLILLLVKHRWFRTKCLNITEMQQGMQHKGKSQVYSNTSLSVQNKTTVVQTQMFPYE